MDTLLEFLIEGDCFFGISSKQKELNLMVFHFLTFDSGHGQLVKCIIGQFLHDLRVDKLIVGLGLVLEQLFFYQIICFQVHLKYVLNPTILSIYQYITLSDYQIESNTHLNYRLINLIAYRKHKRFNQMSGKLIRVFFVLFFVAVITTFILAGFFRRELFQYGVQYIYSIQQPPNPSAAIFFNLIALLGQVYFVGPLFGIIYILCYRKFNAIVYLIYMALNIYIITLSKQAFQDGRPFWENNFIDQLEWGCTTQYGFPSGHSWVSVLIFEPILSDFVGLGPYRWGSILLILTGILIPYCRLYLGVHSVDQITIGVCMSITMLALYRLWAQKSLYVYVFHCLDKKKRKIPILVATILASFLLFLIPLILFVVNTGSRPLSQSRLAEVNASCDKELTVYTIQRKHSLQGALVQSVFGLAYGIMLASRYGSYIHWKCYYTGIWRYQKKRNVIFKFLLYIAILGPIVGIFVILIPHFVENFYGAYICQALGLLLSGISISFVVPLISMKCKFMIPMLDDEETQNLKIKELASNHLFGKNH